MRVALLYTGGLDSYCAWRLLPKPLTRVWVDLGTATCRQEGVCDRALDGRWMRRLERSDGHVPLRNLLLVSMAVQHGFDLVYLAAVRGEGSLDKSSRFFQDTSRLLSFLEGRRVIVRAPFGHLTKTALVRQALREGVTPDDLKCYTSSCYEGTPLPCGRCQACVRRWVALSLNGIEEQFDTPPIVRARLLLREASWRRLRGQPVRRWPDLLANNLDLLRAVRQHGRAVGDRTA